MRENIFFDKKELKYCGTNVIIGKTVRIRRPQDTVIGDNVIIDDFTYISAPLEVGDYSHIGPNTSIIGGCSSVTIGNFVEMAPGCNIVAASNDYRHGSLVGPCIPEISEGVEILDSAPVCIDDFALIACNCTILPGVHVPEGMAIGAYSLVKRKSYNKWSLYAGIPCRLLGERDKEEILKAAKKVGEK